MATGIGDRAGRQRILEGLWLIGIEPPQLAVDPGLDGNAFLDALHRNGVNDDFIRRAIAGVDWRASSSGGSLVDKVANLLQASGYRQDEIDAFRARTKTKAAGGTTAGGMVMEETNPGSITRILAELFNDRTAGAMIYKATGGQDVAGAVWNPFRTDNPPKNANVNYGTNGVMVANLPAGMTATEPQNKYAQPAVGPAVQNTATSGVPTPPASIKATPPKTPGAPTISGQTPGAPGAPGAGGPGGGPAGIPQPVKLTPQQLRDQASARYGWAAAFVDIPEVANLINQYANGDISLDELDRRYRGTDFYKTTSSAERNWLEMEKTEPEDAKENLRLNVEKVTNLARATGAVLDPARIQEIALNDLKYNWTDQMVNQAIASEVHYDPTGAKTGMLAKIKGMQRDSLVPISDQTMTAWAQSIIGGTKTEEDFSAYLRDQAKSMFPALAGALDSDPNMTVRHYLDPYGQQAGKILGLNPDDIDWTDQKWSRFVNQVDPKTGQRTVMNLADMGRTLMADDQYGFDQTVNGKQTKNNLTRSLLQQMGFMAGGS